MNIELTQEQAEAFGRGESITLTPKPKQWKPTVSLDWVDRAHISTYTLLLKYVKEFGGDWVADWEDADQAKYCLFYDYSRREWDIKTTYEYCVSGTVYMSPNCALELADKINSGCEVIL